jgi:hypothetical protein
MITSSIACITYITALLVFPGSNSVPFLLPPDELEAQGNLAMNWDVTDLDFLDHLSANDKHACSTGNAFVDKEIKNGPSGEALEFVSNNEEALDTVRSSVSRILKRAIDDDEKKFDQQLQNGMLILCNCKIIMLIQNSLMILTARLGELLKF